MAGGKHARLGTVSLAYDGGLADHREVVLPILDGLDLRATFCMPPEALLESPVAWQLAAQRGHELGVHSLYGVTLDGALENWSLDMVHGDLELSRRLIEELAGCPADTFVFPGRRQHCADGDYTRVVREVFSTARVQKEGLNDPGQDPHGIVQCYARGLSGPELIKKVELAASSGKWLVLAFDGVGAGSRGCDVAAHAELALWLSKAADHIETRTVSDAASRLLRVRSPVRA